MCEKCLEIDEKIERFRRLSNTVDDQRVMDTIKTLIDQMEAEKIGLHRQGN
jgi:hypothetical protein